MSLLTFEQLREAVGLSQRVVRRYLAAEGIEAASIQGSRHLYDSAAVELVKEASLAARARRTEAIRAAVAERTAIVQSAKVRRRMPKGSHLLTLDEIKAVARKRGGAR